MSAHVLALHMYNMYVVWYKEQYWFFKSFPTASCSPQKADRAALEGKASRDWVSSTFDKLDQQIRQARDQLLGQEEALRSAVHRLDEDVETKLDKGELEPLKDYFGEAVSVCVCVEEEDMVF